MIEQRLGERRRRCRGKTRAQAIFGVGRQGKLRNQQQTAADIVQRQVHFAFGIAEHPVVEQLVQQLGGTGLGITGLDGNQHQQALVD